MPSSKRRRNPAIAYIYWFQLRFTQWWILCLFLALDHIFLCFSQPQSWPLSQHGSMPFLAAVFLGHGTSFRDGRQLRTPAIRNKESMDFTQLHRPTEVLFPQLLFRYVRQSTSTCYSLINNFYSERYESYSNGDPAYGWRDYSNDRFILNRILVSECLWGGSWNIWGRCSTASA